MTKYCRCLAGLLAAAFVLGLCTALAEPQNKSLMTERIFSNASDITSMAVADGRLLIKAKDGLYAWQADSQEPMRLAEYNHSGPAAKDDPTYYSELLYDGQALFGFNGEKGVLLPIAIKGQTAVLGEKKQLDWSHFIVEEGDSSSTQQPVQLLLAGQTLYLMAYDNRGGLALMGADTQDGTLKSFAVPNITAMTPYRDGQLLVLTMDPEKDYDANTNQYSPQIGGFDPARNQLTTLHALQIEGEDAAAGISLAYAPQEDTLYALVNNTVYCSKQL